jgi:hypothetical protein
LPAKHRQVGLDSIRDGDRARAGATAAVRLRERLVEVHVDDVEPHVARAAAAHDRVQVCAVVVEGRPAGVDNPGDLGDVLVEDAERVRVGEHQAGDALVDLRAQVVQVHPTPLVGRNLHHLIAGHRHRRGVRPV